MLTSDFVFLMRYGYSAPECVLVPKMITLPLLVGVLVPGPLVFVFCTSISFCLDIICPSHDAVSPTHPRTVQSFLRRQSPDSAGVRNLVMRLSESTEKIQKLSQAEYVRIGVMLYVLR